MNGLHAMRTKAGLSQEDVAKAIEVTQGAVSQWESGATTPSAKLLPKIAELLNCSIDDLYIAPPKAGQTART